MTDAFPSAALPDLTVDQMREVDRIMIDVLDIGLLQMMENAGQNLAGSTTGTRMRSRMSSWLGGLLSVLLDRDRQVPGATLPHAQRRRRALDESTTGSYPASMATRRRRRSRWRPTGRAR
jgi:hypothetical protein